jgi:hypothetical protein
MLQQQLNRSCVDVEPQMSWDLNLHSRQLDVHVLYILDHLDAELREDQEKDG